LRILILKYLKDIIFLAIFLISLLAGTFGIKMNSETKNIFYHLDSPTSFDPLEADRAANLPIARMLFLTPLEISVNNDLVSTVFDKFSYDPQSNTITFISREDLKYSDGQILTVRDITLSITRMLHARPDFPVIKEIIGKAEWLKTDFPLLSLPSGIQVDKNRITIRLQRPVLNPLFRFTLELFSIIPEKCIDLRTSQLLCKIPPSSGYYSLIHQNNSTYEFRLRMQPFAHKITAPQKINISYINNKQLAEFNFESPKNAVLFGLEYFFLNARLSKNIADVKFKYLPYSYFYSLIFNPNIKPFDNMECRKKFVSLFRNNLKKITSEFNFSKSIFTPILPGYLDDGSFEENISIQSRCSIPKSLSFFDPKDNSFFAEALNLTYKDFLIDSQQLFKPDSIIAAENKFLENKLPVLTFGSGFWSLDPVGDLQMMFTPNLHPRLHFISNDPKMRTLLKDLEGVDNDLAVKEKMESINIYLNQNALMNIYLHSRKFYASKDIDQLRELPQQISAPSIWQIFK